MLEYFVKFPVANILFLGLPNSGKTHALYRLSGFKSSQLKPKPTRGFNNEEIELGEHLVELWDAAGYETSLWESFYSNVFYNVCVYFVDMSKYKVSFELEKKRIENPFTQDRMEIHYLLHDPNFRETKFYIFFNFKNDHELSVRQREMAEEVRDVLELYKFPPRYNVLGERITEVSDHIFPENRFDIEVIMSYDALKQKLLRVHNLHSVNQTRLI